MGLTGSSTLKVENYEQDKVYAFNFPSSRTCVSASPFGLKLETWLRIKQIPHETIRAMGNSSSKGQIPFIEYNGKEYNESTLVIQFLTKEFDKADSLSAEQRALGRVISVVLDNRTVFSYAYYRYVERPWETISQMEFLPAWQAKVFAVMMPQMVKRKLASHGIGRNSPEEIYQIGCDDLLALSVLLGNKKFLLGDQLSTVDASAFAHLAQILYLPIDYPHKSFIMEKARNLSDYADRVKAAVWPDWDEICRDNLQSQGRAAPN